MKLLTFPITTNALKVELFLAASGIDANKEIIYLNKRQHQTPEFLSINPKGLIPVLIDGDFVVTESNLILSYLNEKENGSWGSLHDNRIAEWLFWQATTWAKAVDAYHHECIVKTIWNGQKDEAKLIEQNQSIARHSQFLNHALSSSNWLMGATPSIADIAISAPIMFWKETGLPLHNYPSLLAWLCRLEACNWWQSTKLATNNFIREVRNFDGD